jgi:hypothetical protein
MYFGMCLQCRRKFWWTGERKDVPPCGGCGRYHTQADFTYGKKEQQVTDASERLDRRGKQ